MKKIITGVLIIVLVCIIAVILAPVFIDLNKYKETIISQVEQQIHRDVDFQSIDLAILGGIGAEINGLKITDNPEFSQEDFVSLESLEVYLEFLPLLKKQIKVKKIVLNKPYISVQRNAAGQFNFDDLLNLQQKKPETPGQKPPQPAAGQDLKKEPVKDTPSPLLAVFVVKKLVVSQAKVIIDDKILFQGKPPVVIDGIDLDMDNISLTDVIDIDLKAQLLGARKPNIRFSGSVGPIGSMETLLKTPFDLNLSLDELPLGDLPVDLPMDVLSGKLQIRADASGSPQGMITSDAKVMLDNLVLAERDGSAGKKLTGKQNREIVLSGPAQIKLVSNAGQQGTSIEADADMKGMRIAYGEDFDKPNDMPLSIAFKGDMNKELINASSVQFVLRDLVMDGSGSVETSGEIPEVNIRMKTQPVSLKGWDRVAPVLKTYDLEGAAELTADVTGPVDDLSMNITTVLETAGFAVPDSGEGGKADGKSRAVLHGTDIKIQAHKKKDILSGSAQAVVGKGTIRDVEFADFSGQLQLTPEDLSIKSFRVKVFDGSVSGTGQYVLESGKWSAAPVFDGIASGTLLDTLTSYKGIFSGMFSGNFKLGGLAKEPGINSLDASGSFTLKNGIWNNFDLAGTVMDDFWQIKEMAEQAGVPGENIERHNQTSFDSLDATITMSKGQLLVNPVILNNIRTSQATDSLASLKGIVDMNTRALDLKGDVTLSKKQSDGLVKRTPALSALQDKQQRIVLPVRIKGTLVKPLLALDTRNVNEALARYYTRKGVKKLQEKYGIPGVDTGAEEAVDQLLKGILGN